MCEDAISDGLPKRIECCLPLRLVQHLISKGDVVICESTIAPIIVATFYHSGYQTGEVRDNLI